MKGRAEIERKFPWGVWALVGAVAWAVAMVSLGPPIFAILAPVCGVIVGWAVGGVIYLVATSLTGERDRRGSPPDAGGGT